MNTLADSVAAPIRQHTVARSAEWRGERRRRRTDVLVVHPAETDTGVRFLRAGSAPSAAIPARWDTVVDTRGGVALGDAHGTILYGVTALLAALRVAGIDNVLVEVQGSRIPAGAGDFAFYYEMLAALGTQTQPAPRRLLRVLDTIEVRDSFGFVTLTPASRFRACINTTTFRPGGPLDHTYGVLESDFSEPQAAFRADLHGSDAATRADDDNGSRPRSGLGDLHGDLRATAIELIGNLALAGAFVAGNVHVRGAGPSLYQALLHALMEHRATVPTTVDAQCLLDRTTTTADREPATCPVCNGGAGRS